MKKPYFKGFLRFGVITFQGSRDPFFLFPGTDRCVRFVNSCGVVFAFGRLWILNWEEEPFVTDLGVTTFTVTYANKTKATRDFILPGDDFKECFAIIKQMVPGCEYMPAVLLTSEDYADDEV